MKFYDENMDLYQLIEKANLGDVGAMIKCIGYFISMGDSENDILKELRLNYIDELAQKDITPGLIWKGDELLKTPVSKEQVDAAIAYYTMAAIKGEIFGLECIADMFFEGKGVADNWDVAKYLFWTVMYLSKDYDQKISSMTYYELGVIEEDIARDEDDYEYVKMFYILAIDAAGEFAKIDDYAIKAQEALWRLSA